MAPGIEIGYVKVYIWDYGGTISALDLKTEHILRTIQLKDNGFDKSTLWPHTGSLCDGMLFLGQGSLYNPPLYPKAYMLANNCTNGEIVWKILGFSNRMVAANADPRQLEDQ